MATECIYCCDESSRVPLMRACQCRSKWVHRHCLTRWRLERVHPLAFSECELCHGRYRMRCWTSFVPYLLAVSLLWFWYQVLTSPSFWVRWFVLSYILTQPPTMGNQFLINILFDSKNCPLSLYVNVMFWTFIGVSMGALFQMAWFQAFLMRNVFYWYYYYQVESM